MIARSPSRRAASQDRLDVVAEARERVLTGDGRLTLAVAAQVHRDDPEAAGGQLVDDVDPEREPLGPAV